MISLKFKLGYAIRPQKISFALTPSTSATLSGSLFLITLDSTLLFKACFPKYLDVPVPTSSPLSGLGSNATL